MTALSCGSGGRVSEAGGRTPPKEAPMTATLTREALALRIERGDDFVLAEVLPEPYWRKAHLPGAVALPLDEVEARAGRLFPDRSTSIVLYCANVECLNSHVAAERLSALGYTDVRIYEGGKADWRSAGLPLESAATPSPPHAGERE